MKNKEQTTFKHNASKPVYKFNLSGKLVHTYERMTDAIHEEHVSHSRMSDLMVSGIPLRKHYFSAFENITPPAVVIQKYQSSQMPWESDNGMFDISGWGKVCL